MLNHGGDLYIIQNTFKLKNKLNRPIIEKSIKHLFKRYPVLKTSFITLKNGKTKQVIVDKRDGEYKWFEFKFNYADKDLKAILEKDLSRGFDLKDDCLFRVIYIQFFDLQFLIFSFHHIIIDGWSSQRIIGDFFNFCEGKNLEEISVEVFPKYIKWIKNRDYDSELAYWNGLLGNYNEMCKIPELGYKNLHLKSSFEMKQKKISKTLTKKIIDICQSYGVTLSTFTETCWGIILKKYTSLSEVTFAKILSGREAPIHGIENAVGMFINTIPAYYSFNNNDTLKELLAKAQIQTMEGLENSHISMSKIFQNSYGGDEILNSLFVFENYPIITDFNSESFVKIDAYCREQTSFPISISFSLFRDELWIELSYNTQKYCEEEIELLLFNVEYLLELMVSNLDTRLSELDLVSKYEKTMIEQFTKGDIIKLNETTSIIDYFNSSVKNFPNRPALVLGEKIFTYYELDLLSNSAVQLLVNNDIKRGDIIPVISSDSCMSIVAILGILKYGCSYVPIDSSCPSDRLLTIIKQLSPKVIFSEISSLILDDSYTILKLEFSFSNIELDMTVSGEDLAYLIYTSGTTGEPKGVQIRHKNVVNLCEFIQKKIYLNKYNLNVSVMAPKSFDASIQNIFTALMFGHTLFIVPSDFRSDPIELLNFFNKNKIHISDGTPSHLKLFKYCETLEYLPKVLMIGGETLSSDIVSSLYEKNSNIKIYNLYGPTETTVDSTFFLCDKNCKKVTIGGPIDNVNVFIVDENMKAVGLGVVGEIVIGGLGVGAGYFNNQKLTNCKFVNGQYRTGDFGRFLLDGNIEFLGRKDRQIKLRGHRIELGEIEKNCLRFPYIEDCVAVSNNDYLTLYFVSKVNLDASLIKDHLISYLPKYSLPTSYVQISKIPLLSNGKINYSKLPVILKDNKTIDQKSNFQSTPLTEKEKEILKIFSDVLKTKNLSMGDNFYDFGGNSIKLVELCFKLKSIGIDLSLRKLKQHCSPKEVYQNINKTLERSNIISKNTKSLPKSTFVVGAIKPTNLFFKNCFYSSLFPALKFLGGDFKPLIANTIYYFTFSKGKLEFIPIDVKSESVLLEEQGITIVKSHQSYNSLNDFIVSRVLNKVPVIIPVDPYYECNRRDTYNKVHAHHFVLVFGYDSILNDYIVIDQGHIDSLNYEVRRIPMNDILNGYKGVVLHSDNVVKAFELKKENNIRDLITFEESGKKYLENSKQYIDQLTEGIFELKNYLDFVITLNKDAFRNDYQQNCVDITNKVIHYRKALLEIVLNQRQFQLIKNSIISWERLRIILLRISYENTSQNFNKLKKYLSKVVELEKKIIDEILL